MTQDVSRPISIASRAEKPAPLDRVLQPQNQQNESGALHPLMQPEANVQRIMTTGTVWFAAAVGAIALVLGPLLSSGWRPAELSNGLELLWWVGALLVGASVGLIGWSGCPILEVDVPTADRNKTRTMQIGTFSFIVGSAVAVAAVLLGS